MARGRALLPVLGHAQGESLSGAIVPIVRRIPAYLRLAWALAREPAVPKRHKALLLSAVVYPFTPAQMVANFVPVLGQVDGVLLLLLGLRQVLAHCPAEARAAHLRRMGLAEDQIDTDLATVKRIARRAASHAGRYVVGRSRFAGRVAGGFARRTARRWMAGTATDGGDR